MIPIEKAIGILLLLYLIGPPVILYAKGTQEHAAGLAWQAEKRWAQVNGSAFLSLLLYVPIALFHGPLASCWTTLFVTFAQWFHLPWLAWFGDTSILPPLPSSILLRWVLAFPLAGLLALLIEMARPRTTWETKRIVTPEEQQEVAAMQATEEKKQLAAEKRKQTRAAQQTNTAQPGVAPTPKKKRIPRVAAKPKDEQFLRVPKDDSLWGSIDWSKIPETHPLKQEVNKEAARRDAQWRENERLHWLKQQVSSFTTDNTPVPPSKTIDSTLASPTEQAAASPPKAAAPSDNSEGDLYNWDEGEGLAH